MLRVLNDPKSSMKAKAMGRAECCRLRTPTDCQRPWLPCNYLCGAISYDSERPTSAIHAAIERTSGMSGLMGTADVAGRRDWRRKLNPRNPIPASKTVHVCGSGIISTRTDAFAVSKLLVESVSVSG